MKKLPFYKINILLLFVFCCFPAFSMRDFTGPLPTANVETWELARTYRKLCSSYNDDKNLFEDAFENFEEMIFLPVLQNSNPTNSFLTRARGTRDKIVAEANNVNYGNNPKFPMFYSSIEEKILPKLNNRIDLARLDENVFQGFGSLGAINNFTNDVNLQNTINLLTGRIFQIDLIDGIVDIDQSSILSTSSGTMVNYNLISRQINDLLPLAGAQLNGILTCAHSL